MADLVALSPKQLGTMSADQLARLPVQELFRRYWALFTADQWDYFTWDQWDTFLWGPVYYSIGLTELFLPGNKSDLFSPIAQTDVKE